MKKIVFSLLLGCLLASSSFADVLMTPASMGTDNIAVQGFYNSTPVKLAESNITIWGPKVLYGINDEWDIIGKVGSVSTNVSGSNTGATEIGIGGKYTIPKSKWNTPVDVAAVLSYDSISGKDINWSITSVGLIACKTLRANFDIYAVLYGMMNNNKFTGGKSQNSNDCMWGFGTKYQYNKKFSGLAELMMYTMASDSYQTFSFAVQYEM